MNCFDNHVSANFLHRQTRAWDYQPLVVSARYVSNQVWQHWCQHAAARVLLAGSCAAHRSHLFEKLSSEPARAVELALCRLQQSALVEQLMSPCCGLVVHCYSHMQLQGS